MRSVVVPRQPEAWGKWACFWSLGIPPGSEDQFGIKGFKHNHRADRGHQLQQLGYAQGVAPPVGERVHLVLEDGTPHPKYPYGYETGVCELYQGPRHRIFQNHKTFFDVIHAIFPPIKRGRPLRIGGRCYAPSKANDIKTRNYGWWQGKLVCIDWV